MFDPTKPANHSPKSSAEMRAQLNGLKALIDAIPAVTGAQVEAVETLPPGSPAQVGVGVGGNMLRFTFALPQGAEGLPGAPGAPGPPFAQAVVEAVNTVDPGQPAAVGVDFDGTNVRFTFDIPRGEPGPEGAGGTPGGEGPPGPPFAQAVVDAVDTLPPGEPASVGVGFDGVNVRFTFSLPQGAPGADGVDGAPGQDGAPGEVSLAQLNSALETAVNGTSANSNGVGLLGQSAVGDYNAAQMQQLLDKVDELILALRRS